MEANKVWRKFKWSDIPEGRRCVKHKWVFQWKRDGTARARLVACGYSQVAGVDFQHVFSPVASDVTFRILMVLMIVSKLEHAEVGEREVREAGNSTDDSS